MMLRVALITCALSASFSVLAAEMPEPKVDGDAAVMTEKQQVIQAFKHTCEERALEQCGCTAESLVPALSDAEVTVISSKLQSGEFTTENLIPRNQVAFNRAQNKCKP